ncbi:unnamed protein product [Schistosoma mattheei]|uniref:Uncharacterized protein n=1 Tax=Schistosoma mattheei TaxID=31246 RepID=A0A183P516_9TREM|nr:unnamed protein product [Schistosoma mattheei]
MGADFSHKTNTVSGTLVSYLQGINRFFMLNDSVCIDPITIT